MSLEFKRASPAEVREAAVDLFWRMRHWPYTTQDEYFRYWDWRYSSLSEEEPVVWVATEDQRVIGHIAMYFRRYRFEGRDLRVGVPGNFLVDRSHRDTLVAARLASAPRSLVRDGTVDAVFAYGNKAAHGMFVRMGARELGAMKAFVDVRRWSAVLGRPLRAAAVLAPLAVAVDETRKAVRRRSISRSDSCFEARELGIDEVLSMNRSHWRVSNESLVSVDSPGYLANRFLRCPVRSHHIYGVTDTRTGEIQGVVVTEGTTRVKVWACEVNGSALSEAHAVEVAERAMPEAESVVVPLLPDSALADDFDRAGFWRARSSDEVEANTWWSAFWQPTHPLAARLAEMKRWKLWYGSNHH